MLVFLWLNSYIKLTKRQHEFNHGYLAVPARCFLSLGFSYHHFLCKWNLWFQGLDVRQRSPGYEPGELTTSPPWYIYFFNLSFHFIYTGRWRRFSTWQFKSYLSDNFIGYGGGTWTPMLTRENQNLVWLPISPPRNASLPQLIYLSRPYISKSFEYHIRYKSL